MEFRESLVTKLQPEQVKPKGGKCNKINNGLISGLQSKTADEEDLAIP